MNNERTYHTANYRTHDGRTGCIGFYSAAKTWRGLCRTARTKIWEESLFTLGTTILPDDVATLYVDGNAE